MGLKYYGIGANTVSRVSLVTEGHSHKVLNAKSIHVHVYKLMPKLHPGADIICGCTCTLLRSSPSLEISPSFKTSCKSFSVSWKSIAASWEECSCCTRELHNVQLHTISLPAGAKSSSKTNCILAKKLAVRNNEQTLTALPRTQAARYFKHCGGLSIFMLTLYQPMTHICVMSSHKPI